jgi:transposase-like protein
MQRPNGSVNRPGVCGGSRPWTGWSHGNNHTSSKRYPPEVRERAVALVFSAMEFTGERHGQVTRIARQLDIGPETLRQWVRQAEIDGGRHPGLTTESTPRSRLEEFHFPCHPDGPRRNGSIRPVPGSLRRTPSAQEGSHWIP